MVAVGWGEEQVREGSINRPLAPNTFSRRQEAQEVRALGRASLKQKREEKNCLRMCAAF